jgi:hypothetical protein
MLNVFQIIYTRCEVNLCGVDFVENENNVNKDNEITEKKYLEATRVAALTGLDPLPDDVEIYKCPKCQKIFLGPDILWINMKNSEWEPFCRECEKIHLKKIR